MRKTMKKISATILALCMVFAMFVPIFAADTTLKTKSIANAGTCSSVYIRCTNYGWLSTYTGYAKAKITLTSAVKKQITAFCSANKVKASVPGTISVSGNNMQKLAWANKNDCGKVTALLKLVDTNKDKKADYLYITVTASPKKATTSQGRVDTYKGTYKIPVK